jgi:ParB/RepB/Spo0J family partition protein
MTKNPPTAKAPVADAIHAAIAGTVETLMLRPSSIAPSPTNPRKSFPEASLLELAASMKADGQVQAITVRPVSVDAMLKFNKDHPDFDDKMQERPQYELVVGERRWRAATLGGLELRAELRELTDLQVVRIQIIENLHREEVHPLEEAEGYEYLLKHSGEGITADQIADEVGKSRSYVHKRMRLVALCDEARKAFYAGKYDASTGLLIARLPTPELQLSAIGDIDDMTLADGAPSYRQIRQMLKERYQLRLETAPFDITDVTLVKGAGACAGCPKRAGNQQVIFDDAETPDICTDPDCFASKRRASVERQLAQARKQGIKVIEGDEAMELAPYGMHSYLGEYMRADMTALRDGDNQAVTYSDLMEREGKKAPKPMLLVHPKYPEAEPVAYIKRDDAQKLAEKHRPADSAGAVPKADRKETAAEIAEREEREIKFRAREIDGAVHQMLQTALLQKADQPRTAADLVLLVFALTGDEVSDDLLLAAGVTAAAIEADDFDHEAALFEALCQMDGAALAALAFRLALGNLTDYCNGTIPTPALERAAQAHGINVAALRNKATKQVDTDEDDEHAGADE